MSKNDALLPKDWPKTVKTSILTAISLAHLAICRARGQAVNSPIERVRLAADLEEAMAEILRQREIERIKDARMATIDALKRPHYPPVERMAILELRAACGWSGRETARRFLVSEATISEWMSRLDEQGKDALVQTPAPVNKYPGFVGYLVRKCNVMATTTARHQAENPGLTPTTSGNVATTTRGKRARRSPPPQPLRRVNLGVGGSAPAQSSVGLGASGWSVSLSPCPFTLAGPV